MNEHTVTGCAGTWRRKAVMPQRGTASPLWAPHSQGPPLVLSTLYFSLLLAAVWEFCWLARSLFGAWAWSPFALLQGGPFPSVLFQQREPVTWPGHSAERRNRPRPVLSLGGPPPTGVPAKLWRGAIVRGVRARSVSRKTERARSPQGLPFT